MTGPTDRSADLTRRLASLPPDRREALARLLRREGGSSVGAAPAPAAPETVDIQRSEIVNDDRKQTMKALYASVNRNLDATAFSSHAVFLNFGYVGDDNQRWGRVALPKFCLNRNCQQLVIEVVGDVDIAGRDVLDVGCGRGGTIATIRSHYAPRRVTGVDLCEAAVRFCGRTHRQPSTHFVNGDAESLPLADASVDVVTNVESSHSYPHIDRFYREVVRVLRPGGYFLYTDMLPRGVFESCIETLEAVGLVLERRVDITSNVLLSCDDTARTHLETFEGKNDADVMGNFLALPGSKTYEDMRTGRSTYEILKLRKA